MKIATTLSLLILLGLCAAMFACQPLAKNMSIQDVYGACRSVEPIGCGPINQDSMCNEYVGVLSQSHPDAKSCRQACQRVQNSHTMNLMGGGIGCADVYSNMASTCMQYCNGQYPK